MYLICLHIFLEQSSTIKILGNSTLGVFSILCLILAVHSFSSAVPLLLPTWCSDDILPQITALPTNLHTFPSSMNSEHSPLAHLYQTTDHQTRLFVALLSGVAALPYLIQFRGLSKVQEHLYFSL